MKFSHTKERTMKTITAGTSVRLNINPTTFEPAPGGVGVFTVYRVDETKPFGQTILVRVDRTADRDDDLLIWVRPEEVGVFG